ncbi:acyltransferase family protein [Nitratireductor luteus]|uniref:acyltransferase family protein n=1 Tax=Nitratireductor luteus TaxID=2976980 RepID=UPI002240DC16|nr:acyltransferase [Nitratireductor luteus]
MAGIWVDILNDSRAGQGGSSSAVPNSAAKVNSAAVDRRVQIDGLRTIAMIGVLYVHFCNPNPALEHVRVSLFFVVSGFLITHILTRAHASGSSINVLNFYIRRSLRLFPALLLALSLAAIINMQDIRDSILWHMTQLSNVYFALHKTWEPWVAAHLWSLNTVEQFYLLCPIAIFFLGRSAVTVFFIAVMVGSILLRVHAYDLGFDGWVSILFAYDPIAAGAILALLKDHREIQAVLRHPANIALSLLIIFSPLAFGSDFGETESYRLLIIYALVSIVSGAYVGFGGIARLLLDNGVVRLFSRISYGVYVYHFFVWWIVAGYFPTLYEKNWTTFFTMSALTIVVATLSWLFIEKHFDRMKHRFPVQKRFVEPACP